MLVLNLAAQGRELEALPCQLAPAAFTMARVDVINTVPHRATPLHIDANVPV